MGPSTDVAVALETFADARTRFSDRKLRVRTLAPISPSFGVGALRVLRVSERADELELVIGYERYERLRTGSRG